MKIPFYLPIGDRAPENPPEAVLDQRVFQDAKGRVVIYRSVVIDGELPEGFAPFTAVGKFQVKTPNGPMVVPFETPYGPEVETLAQAFAGYDAIAKKSGEEAVAELERQLIRQSLAGGHINGS